MRDPEKWDPVFGEDHAQSKESDAFTLSGLSRCRRGNAAQRTIQACNRAARYVISGETTYDEPSFTRALSTLNGTRRALKIIWPKYGMMRPMLDLRGQQPKLLAGPPCERCGGVTRLMRIEPHKRYKRRHIWALECMDCGTAQTAEMPAPQRVN